MARSARSDLRASHLRGAPRAGPLDRRRDRYRTSQSRARTVCAAGLDARGAQARLAAGLRALRLQRTVRRPNRDGTEYLTSQVGFSAKLTEEICANHPDYVAHGQPDTTIANDSVIPDEEQYLAEVERMRDGAMLASKTFIVRSSLDTKLCSEGMMPNFSDGGLPPGFPPDGGPPPGMPPKPDAG